MRNKIEFILDNLNKILSKKEPIRIELIKLVQNEIWNDESITDESLNEILSELAYDLDFYEPNEEWRKEDPSYYGDDRLEDVIRKSILLLKSNGGGNGHQQRK